MTLFDDQHADVGLASAWLKHVTIKERSRDPDIRSSFYLGSDVRHGVPVYLPRRVLDAGHFVVRGTTGSGKTSATLMPLALQALRGYAAPDGLPATPSPIVIIDLKGDDAFFHVMWEAARRAGRRFRYFSVQTGVDYHVFDPLQIFQLGQMAPLQLATAFVRAFSLDYGLIYGGLYFTHQNLALLFQAIAELQQRPTDTLTIAAMSQAVGRLARATKAADAQHIQSCLSLLAAYPQVRRELASESGNEFIHMPRVLEDCEVVYFHLKLQDQAPSLRQVAAFAMQSLIQAAQCRREQGLPQRDTFVFVDEFYHVAGKSFGDQLSTVREWGLHFILSHQTPKQLEHHDPALPDVIQGNSSVEQAYSLTPEDERYFQTASGATRPLEQSVSIHPITGYQYSIRPVWDFQLSDQEMKQVSDTPLRSLLLTKLADTKLRADRVRIVEAAYPLTAAEYRRLRFMPLPKRVLMPVATPRPAAPDVAPRSAPPPPKSEYSRRPKAATSPSRSPLHERLRQKWDELAGLERF